MCSSARCSRTWTRPSSTPSKALQDGTLTLGDDYLGTLANGGVGLGPFHNFDTKVSDELKAELEQVQQDIIDGKIDAKATGS